MPERGIHKHGPYTGDGKDKPDERNLSNAGRKIKVVQRDADGKAIKTEKSD